VDGIAIERNYLAGAPSISLPAQAVSVLGLATDAISTARSGHPRELSREEIWGALGGPQGAKGLDCQLLLQTCETSLP
jgi:hypothetical protein